MKGCCGNEPKRRVAAFDLVCGMTTDNPDGFIKHTYGGKDYFFCSYNCLDKFKDNPERYIPGKVANKEEQKDTTKKKKKWLFW